MFKKKFKRVFLALDTNNIKIAENFVKLLKKDLAGIKIGNELFSCYGPSIIKKFQKYKISEIENIVDLFFREIQKALTEEKRVEIRGFGSFYTKKREKRIGINPQNGKNIEIEKKVHPKFKMGKILFKKLNSK